MNEDLKKMILDNENNLTKVSKIIDKVKRKIKTVPEKGHLQLALIYYKLGLFQDALDELYGDFIC